MDPASSAHAALWARYAPYPPQQSAAAYPHPCLVGNPSVYPQFGSSVVSAAQGYTSKCLDDLGVGRSGRGFVLGANRRRQRKMRLAPLSLFASSSVLVGGRGTDRSIALVVEVGAVSTKSPLICGLIALARLMRSQLPHHRAVGAFLAASHVR
uniref:Uncharacterized protein n=1 Tax=Plectus sambesii TaxID=2011161 RepID=A0A914WYN7_9BILA